MISFKWLLSPSDWKPWQLSLTTWPEMSRTLLSSVTLLLPWHYQRHYDTLCIKCIILVIRHQDQISTKKKKEDVCLMSSLSVMTGRYSDSVWYPLSWEEKLLTKLSCFLWTGDFMADSSRVAVDLIVISSRFGLVSKEVNGWVVVLLNNPQTVSLIPTIGKHIKADLPSDWKWQSFSFELFF